MLSNRDKNKIIESFPDNFELKKFKRTNYIQDYQDYYVFIPKGKKYFVWLKNDNSQKCYFMEFKNNKIVNCYLKIVSVDEKLFTNTLFYGTLLNNDFIIEDILYFKNEYVYNNSFDNKCKKYFIPFFKKYCYNHKLKSIERNFIHFYIAPFEVHYNNIENKMIEISMPLYEIIQVKNYKCLSYNIFNKSYIFKILPDLKNDIYNLYVYDYEKKEFIIYDTALINNYISSKYVNNIFNLNTKMIENIDNIELSDSDEEEMDENSFLQKKNIINENNNVFVKCIYNYKFKKWKPIEKMNLSLTALFNNRNFVTTKNINMINKEFN